MKMYIVLTLLLTGLTMITPLQSTPVAAPIAPGKYRHYSGSDYEVIGTAHNSENPEELFVVYKQLYESKNRDTGEVLPTGTIWIRPAAMFQETITYKGAMVARFTKID